MAAAIPPEPPAPPERVTVIEVAEAGAVTFIDTPQAAVSVQLVVTPEAAPLWVAEAPIQTLPSSTPTTTAATLLRFTVRRTPRPP